MDAKTLCRGDGTKDAPNLMDGCSIGVNSIPKYVIDHIEIDKLRRSPAALILSYLNESEDAGAYSIRIVGDMPSDFKPTKLAARIAFPIDGSHIEVIFQGIVNHPSDAEDITKQIISAKPPVNHIILYPFMKEGRDSLVYGIYS